MNIGELRALLATISSEDDSRQVVCSGGDHAYYEKIRANFTDIVDEGNGNLGEWYGNPEDYGYKTLQSMRKSGKKIIKALVIE